MSSTIALAVASFSSIQLVWSYGVFVQNDDPGSCCPAFEPSPLGANISEQTCVVGPPCTMGVHNNFSDCACPGRPQASDSANLTDFREHLYADEFVMDFRVYMFNTTVVPPRIPESNVTQFITNGTTYYDINVGGGFMREHYDTRCLPIFGKAPLNTTEGFSCDFYTLNDNNTAYLVLHDDKPSGAPDCCIIGNPFRAPPQDFFQKLSTKYQTYEPFADGVEPGMEDDDELELVDWRKSFVESMNGDVIYGFLNNLNDSHVPFAFIFTGLPFIAEWNYQRFFNFEATKPDSSVSILPATCLLDTVTACPGWEPWTPASACAGSSCADDTEGDGSTDFANSFSIVWCFVLSFLLCFV